jgi:hypothetical protein
VATITQTMVVQAVDATEFAKVQAEFDASGATVVAPKAPVMSRTDDPTNRTVTLTCDLGTRTTW